ncbi:F0F1 ATP synthase subunit B [Ideonella azotifigens]|uniref:ATP synthase subunit b n=2 Tax=Ideonella azotifigens TaxID=513160 RepID=A0ABN1K7L6_9BURK|nr:F0F1 ATP synthase subunit B [Ideonella azotifigens]MCD2342319.1 F0F1 ATP synthase subunit B [Ideonella azotifigens]
MLIDWFTVGAQALNFVILVALLKRFLYQPVLDAVDAREAQIAKQLADAKAIAQQAQAQQDSFAQKSAAFERERAELLAQARREADAEQARLIAAARQAADALSARRLDALHEQAATLEAELRDGASREVFAISRKVLAELASAELEALATRAFMQRLQALDAADRQALAAALAVPTAAPRLSSAFALPAAQRAEIQAALTETFGAVTALQFVVAPDLVCGLELVAGGQKLAWSIAQHLDGIAQVLTDLLARQQQGARPEAAGAVQAQGAA